MSFMEYKLFLLMYKLFMQRMRGILHELSCLLLNLNIIRVCMFLLLLFLLGLPRSKFRLYLRWRKLLLLCIQNKQIW